MFNEFQSCALRHFFKFSEFLQYISLQLLHFHLLKPMKILILIVIFTKSQNSHPQRRNAMLAKKNKYAFIALECFGSTKYSQPLRSLFLKPGFHMVVNMS